MTVNYEIGKPRQDGKMRITILVCIGNTKKRIKTELFASSADLNRKGKLRNDSPIYNKVRLFSMDIEKEYAKLDTFSTGEKMTASEFMDKTRSANIPTFFAYAEKWMERSEIKGLKNYKTALNKFRAFVGTDIPFSYFSHKVLDDFKYFLKDYKRAQSQYLSAIKKIYSDAEKDYPIAPFYSFHFNIPQQKHVGQRALDFDVLKMIFSFHGTGKREILARDCCVLSFLFCGINSVDLYNAPKIKGNKLSYDRQKTKERRYDNAHMEIEILPQAKELVNKYKDSVKAFSFHRRYSSAGTFNTAINKGLSSIQKELERIYKTKLPDFSFYAIRHTWATIARNDLGIDKYTIHDALCHIDHDTAIDDLYIKKDYKNINIANRKVADFVFGGL